MRGVIADVERRYGQIHGVFYAAGSKVNRTILEINREECLEQLRPQWGGLPVLEKILNGRNLDFVFLASSLASVLGAIGFSAYPAAHTFVDAFVHAHNRGSSLPWTCVNLDNWINSEEITLIKSAGTASFGITSEEGAQAIKHILSMRNTPQVLVSTAELQQRMEQ
jgi:hypothetical protein